MSKILLTDATVSFGDGAWTTIVVKSSVSSIGRFKATTINKHRITISCIGQQEDSFIIAYDEMMTLDADFKALEGWLNA